MYRNMKQLQYQNSLGMKKLVKNEGNKKPGSSKDHSINQSKSKDNKVTSHGKRTNKIINQQPSSNRQNDSLSQDKEMSRSQTSRNPSL